MAKIITEETKVVKNIPHGNTQAQVVSTQAKADASETTIYVIYFLAGVIEVLLAFRFILKLAGANPASGFVRFIYGLSQIFIMPFEGIFRRAVNQGVEVSSIFEPATVVAMVVYMVVVWGIIQLIGILAGKTAQEV